MPPLPQIADPIEYLTARFNLTGNRALAWHIYHQCRLADRQVPEEIQAVVDRFAAGVSAAAQAAMGAQPGDAPVRFTSADVGRLWRDDDENDPVGVIQAETVDAKIAADILKRNSLGDSVSSAIEHWAAKQIHRRGSKRLWQIWAAFQKPPAPGPRTVR